MVLKPRIQGLAKFLRAVRPSGQPVWGPAVRLLATCGLAVRFLATREKCGSEALDERQGFSELRKEGFFGFECGGVDAAAQAAHADWMLEMKHFVVEQVFDCVSGAGGAVEDAAHDDGVVSGVVMAERTLGVVFAPGEFGATEQSAEEARVE